MPIALWGFCEHCELWRLSTDWYADGGGRPACPVCGVEPSPLEQVENGCTRVLLNLELPPGSELPMLS